MNDLKPLVKSRRMPLMRKVSGSSLTPCAAESLIAGAEISSDGDVTEKENEFFYNGASYLSIALDGRYTGLDEADYPHLLASAKRSVLLHLGLLRLARLEAERRCSPRLVREMEATMDFHIDGGSLFVDIEVECPLAEQRGAEGEG